MCFTQYSFVLLPFNVTACVAEETGPVITQRVEIATDFADGPIPKAFTHRPSEAGHINDRVHQEETMDLMFLNPLVFTGFGSGHSLA